jgi:WD40 repeat protein
LIISIENNNKTQKIRILTKKNYIYFKKQVMKPLLILFTLIISFLSFSNPSPEVVLTTGHNDQINAMVVSANNKYLASAGNNKIIKIWDISSNREFRSISGTNGRIIELAFSEDNIHLVGTTNSEELIVWNVVTGEEVLETKCNSGFYGLSFYNDGNDIVFLDENSNICTINLKTKVKSVLDNELYITNMVVDKTNQLAYVTTHLAELAKFDLQSKTKLTSVKLFDKPIYAYTASKISKDGRYIVNALNDDKVRVFDTKENKFIFTSKKFSAKIMAFEMSPSEPIVYFTLHTGEVVFYDYLKQKKIFDFKDDSFIANCIASYPSGEALLIANYNTIRFFDSKSKKEFKRLEPKVSKILNMAYDQNGKYLAVASDKVNIQIWDLRLNKIVKTIQGFFPCEFSPNGQELVSMSYTTDIAVWDVSNWEKKTEYKTEYELIQKLAFSPDGKYLAGSGFNQVIKIWNRENGELIKKLKGHTHGILALDFHPTKPILASGSHDETVRVWDFMKEKELHQFKDQTVVVSGVKFSPDGNYIATSAWDKTVLIRNTNDWSISKTLLGHTNSIGGIDYNKDGSVLVSFASNNSVSESDNSLIFWDTNTGDKITQIKSHESGITKAFFDLEADYVFSSSDDGTIKISSHNTKDVIATLVSVGANEFMIYTPDNYYIASKNALSAIAFRINGELVSFEQFDIYLNRPDIVAKEIGKSPEQLIKAYKYLYKKRLRKFDLDEGSINLDYQVPSILKETEVPLLTKEEYIKINVKCWDDIYDLKQINVYVNGTPIYGESGILISDKIKSIRKTIDIPLLNGKNVIQISCLNANGAESFYETFEIIKEDDLKKSDLYIATIGVSDYKDTRFTLKYPTKDAKDMIDKLSASTELYNEIHTKMLLNEEVTIEGVQGLLSFFENCKHNDVAILFIAGHGVLNANFDYFYGTYDMDFNNPGERGLAYDEIHLILNKIKAYRKLLIMDTCHSGELDKEEIEEGPEPEVDESDIEFRGAGVSVREKDGFGFENSLELVEDLFSDTRKGSGAIVISSAGGAEYAMESDKWQNGLFTYAFLNGFEITKNSIQVDVFKADYDGNGTVEVSEIRAYVNKSVKEISGGKQIPSSREENISQDYAIFAK